MHFRLTLALLLASGCATATPADPNASARDEFRAQLERAWRPGAPPDSPGLRAYMLYPYLEAARLRAELSRVPDRKRNANLDTRIRKFLKAHGDAPVARDLQRDWLTYLGERAAWPEFRADAPPELASLSLRCHALTARLARREFHGLREEALEAWLAQKEAPPACKPAFTWIDSTDHLSDVEIEWRARFAARERIPLPASLKDLTPARQALLRYWDRVMGQPERELRLYAAGERPEGLAPLPDPDAAEPLLEAFNRVSLRDSKQARLLYEPLRALPFNELQQARLRRDYALGLAYDFDPDAVVAFRDLPDVVLDQRTHEWRVRAALWNRNWPTAAAWIDAMPEPLRQEPRWRYWKARALERREREQAHALYAEVAKEREYYAFLAAERLGRKPDLRPKPLAADPSVQLALSTLPPVQRAKELFLAQLPALAAPELRYALRDRGADDKAQAALLVAGWGWFEPAVRLASETERWDDLALRFPLPYDKEISAAAQAERIPDEWLYAVLRTESLYDARAVSRVGALGLLQLMLPTARAVAKRSGLPKPERDDLFRPEVNIPLGARYLREMLDKFGQRFIFTLAAYNAGPHKVPDWLPPEAVEADVWIENIPYTETRQYVQRALSSLVILSWRRSGQPAPLAPLLQPVAAPRQDAAS